MKEVTYKSVEEDIKLDILSGRIGPNEKISSENELCRIYGLSRTTVRKALSNLINNGYLYVNPGKGNYVSEFVYNRFSFDEKNMLKTSGIDATGYTIRFVNATLVFPDEAFANELHFRSRKRLIQLKRVIECFDKVIGCSYRYLPYGITMNAMEASTDLSGSLFSGKYSNGDFKINACRATAELAETMNISENEPVLCLSLNARDENDNLSFFERTFLIAKYVSVEGE